MTRPRGASSHGRMSSGATDATASDASADLAEPPAVLSALVILSAGPLLAACSTAGSAADPGGARAGQVLQVTAAENFWGSIASQLGGKHVQVTSIITNPNTDPHSYEPTASDARAFAGAQLVIENGIGYDPWAASLLAAGDDDQLVLDVGQRARSPRRGQSASLVQPVRRAAGRQPAHRRLPRARPGGRLLLRRAAGSVRECRTPAVRLTC